MRAGRARRARQAGVSRRGAQGVLGHAGLACWGAQGGRRTGAGGLACARASGSWAQAEAGGRALGARQAGAGRAGRARPGRLGWPWAVHSVHSAHFRSVLTLFFFFLSHQMNTVHCKINFFRKKKIY